jgi:hypothetical protein
VDDTAWDTHFARDRLGPWCSLGLIPGDLAVHSPYSYEYSKAPLKVIDDPTYVGVSLRDYGKRKSGQLRQRCATEMSRDLSTFSVSDCWKMASSLVSHARRSADVDEILTLEERVFLGPVQSVTDAIAKVRAVELSLADGGRSDRIDQQALVLVARWLETNA